MAISSNLISGLSSGIDWATMVEQLIALDHRRVDLIDAKKSAQQAKLTQWQSFNTKLLTLKNSIESLKDASDFNRFKATTSTDSSTVTASELLAVTTSDAAATGSYSLKINSLATAQKLSSMGFASASSALGASYAGDILVGGRVVSVASTDTLTGLRDKINNVNTGDNASGVTASIVSYGAGDIRLILTSTETGAAGISLLNGGATDILNTFGFSDGTVSAKNSLAAADQSDTFADTTTSIKALLGLSTTQTSANGEIVINGHAVDAIDLSTDTITSLQTKLAAAGVDVAVISETNDDDETVYRLQINGAGNTYTDKSNILETLGILRRGVGDIYGVKGSVANTADGVAITGSTLLKDIDGYTGYTDTDYIAFTGTTTGGVAVNDTTFTIGDTTTVDDFLTKIEALYGNVSASIDGTGKLVVENNSPGGSSLAVAITVKNAGGADDGTLKFDADNDLGNDILLRKRELVAGADASITLDGTAVTSTSNTVTDVIEGVTLNLLKADAGTTVTLNVGRDVDSVVNSVTTFASAYNAVSAFIHTQQAYDTTTKTTGGVLFGDGTLSSIKNDLTSVLSSVVPGVTSDFSTLGLVGVSVDTGGQLTVNTDDLREYLATNFEDVMKVFAANGTTSSSQIDYIAMSRNTKAGTYTVNITTAATRSTSIASDADSLTGDETLTITDGAKEATIALTNGMTMAQVVNAINSALDTESIGITASLDGTNHLVLIYDSYGAETFTIEQASNRLWTGGTQTVNNGVNVGGTINGEAATGSGQTLTGDTDEENVEGLAINYTGTSTGNVGTVTLTVGTAELFSRALYNITDSIDGYLTYKQDSIEELITDYDDQMDEMEARLALKQERMLAQYQAMEKALNKIKQQSEWLTAQLSALSS